jgi:hypothetical protein
VCPANVAEDTGLGAKPSEAGKVPRPDPRQQNLELDPPADDEGRRNSDPVAAQAKEFASKLEDLAGVLANPLDETDAAWVNANIGIVAEGADDLISTLVDDAEGKGLEATGDWLPIPLVEQRAFEVPEHDVEADKADAAHDRKMNS